MAKEWFSLLNLLTDYCFENDTAHQIFKISDYLKVLQCYENQIIKKELLKWLNSVQSVSNKTNSKSAKKSEVSRNLGNEKFKSGDYEICLKLYTESIIYAPYDSPELSLALGNRSAVLFRLQQFEFCIRDIDLAIKNHANDELFSKLMIRKGKALFNLKRTDDGINCLNFVKEFINSKENFPVATRIGMINEIRNINDTSIVNNENNENILPPVVSKGKHDSFPYASCLINLEISENDDHNRTVIASDNIEVGDILFVETPFSFVVLPDYYKLHCQNCCKLLVAPIACYKCVDCLYCNEECYQMSYNSYHKWECDGLSLLHNLGIGHLALKTVLIAAQNPSSSKYEQISNLISHLSEVSPRDLLQYVLTATLLVIYLEKFTDFFVESSIWKSVQHVGFLLLKHMVQLICNGFSVKKSSAENYESIWTDFSHVTYASAFYPSASMMNHSCEPNVITSFFNSLLVVRANRPIAEGDQIFNCYGPHFRKMELKERREILKNQFFFNCKCQHCLRPNTEDEFSLYLCSNCGISFSLNSVKGSQIKCDSCLKTSDIPYYLDRIQKVNTLFEKGTNFIEQGDYEQALNVLKKCKLLEQMFMDKNNSAIIRSTIDLAKCCFAIGDYNSSWNYFKECVSPIKDQFGDHSIEYGNIIYKIINAFLSDVKSKQNTITILDRLTDVRRYLDEIENIVKLNFGPWSGENSLLQKQKTEIVNLENVHSSILRLVFI